MNGQTMNYKNYYNIVNNTPGPTPFSELPKIRIDFRAIVDYARKHNLHPNDLSMEEREKFIIR
ncbi:MAG: hypothetical protein K5894_11930 [Lachnospiraceae bacterium]|nr:hypothetical protein [Lachnospiraceae bacterium]